MRSEIDDHLSKKLWRVKSVDYCGGENVRVYGSATVWRHGTLGEPRRPYRIVGMAWMSRLDNRQWKTSLFTTLPRNASVPQLDELAHDLNDRVFSMRNFETLLE